MEKYKSVFDDDAIKEFEEKILKLLLPHSKRGGVSFFGAGETIRASNIKYITGSSNEINYRSKYFYNNKFELIHYTSIPNLISIIKEKKIRLYSLNGMDDKEEFNWALNESKMSLTNYEIEEIKDKIFCLSMCKFDLESSEKSLNQWRSYGNDGHGVGIVFKINKRFARQWQNYMLSKVQYSKESFDIIKKLEIEYEKFKINHNLQIDNFYEILFKYFSFHKNPIYKSEDEIRLIFHSGFSYLDSKLNAKLDINKKYKKTSYIELEIEWEWGKETKKMIKNQIGRVFNVKPMIQIDKIVWGYRLSKEQKYNIIEVLFQYLNEYKHKPSFTESNLSDYFNK